jgi:hypothetical protein
MTEGASTGQHQRRRYRHVDVAANKWFKPDMSGEFIDVAFCQWEVLPGSSEFDFRCVGSELAATSEVVKAEGDCPGFG